MSRKYDAFSASVNTTATGQLDIDVRDAELIRLFAKVTDLTGGAAPSVDFQLVALYQTSPGTFVEGPELSNMGAAVAAANGFGDAGVISCPTSFVRLKWTTAGGPASSAAFVHVSAVR